MVEKETVLNKIQSAGWNIDQKLWDSLSTRDQDFVAYELSGKDTPAYKGPRRTLDYYRSRLQMIGFENLGRVLDAGCGIGQWSIALAQFNEEVVGVDQAEERIQLAKKLALQHQQINCTFQTSKLETLPFKDSSFDAVICYGVLMFTNIPQVLQEFSRVLKTGGHLYVNVNSLGWGAYLLLNRGLISGNIKTTQDALKMLYNTFAGKPNYRFHTDTSLQRVLQKAGFQPLEIQREGHLHLNLNTAAVPPRYPGELYGMKAILDCVAIKT